VSEEGEVIADEPEEIGEEDEEAKGGSGVEERQEECAAVRGEEEAEEEACDPEGHGVFVQHAEASDGSDSKPAARLRRASEEAFGVGRADGTRGTESEDGGE
jgi:hypothetical protein